MFRKAMMMGIACVLLAAAPAMAAVVYQNNFEAPVGLEWSDSRRSTTPVGARTFLGEFSNNDEVSLSLSGLPTHDSMTISFELFVLKSWDGNSTNYGPDIWELWAGGGRDLLRTTFANVSGGVQAYPGYYQGGGGDQPARTGAAENNTLGYSFHGDSVYYLSFTFYNVGSQANFYFMGKGLQGVSDESWGIDNLTVEVNQTVIPIPAAFWLLGSGLLGLIGLRRKLF